jgi:hypothetical protein
MLNLKKLVLIFTISFFSLNLFGFFYEKPQKGDPQIIVAVKNRDMAKLEELIEAGADVEAKGVLGDDTPLLWAFYYAWVDGVKKLLEAGADIYYEKESVNYWNALILSSKGDKDLEMNKKSIELFEILKEHNVPIGHFEFENIDEIREFGYKNPELTKKFFREIRFKKGFWWLYWIFYRPFINITDVALWLDKNVEKNNQ